MLSALAYGVAFACALAMGFAIQRGATCTVIAVDDVVGKRRFDRLGSMLETSVWVLAGLLVARALHFVSDVPAGYALSARTALGGALLGVGAYVNRACVFGAIARLGSGEWSYVATPAGFYAGCVALTGLGLAAPTPLAQASPALNASPWIAAAFVALLLVIRPVFALRQRAVPRESRTLVLSLWSPHTATLVIGITFLVLFLLVGAWSYTDALAELARGMAGSALARALLFAGLLGGAILGGWTAGRLRSARVKARQVLVRFAGGALMAWGTLLIPGGNDGLILLAMPLLWPYAWLAFGAMFITIGAALTIERALRARQSRSAIAT